MPTIDHVHGLSISQEDGWNELATLKYLSAGLAALANQVSIIEEPFRRQEHESGRRFKHFGTPASILPPGVADLFPCLFHWYGVSVCNYARLVGFLGGVGSGAFSRNATEDPRNYEMIKQCCDDYVRSVPELESIVVWRNKVFAHFAITSPRNDDNAALLDFSTTSVISYFDGRLRVGGITVVARGAEIALPQWSVTESFQNLEPRYWPHNTPPPEAETQRAKPG